MKKPSKKKDLRGSITAKDDTHAHFAGEAVGEGGGKAAGGKAEAKPHDYVKEAERIKNSLAASHGAYVSSRLKRSW